MRIVHVETGRHVYGGARQVLYLAKGLEQHEVDSVLVCPMGSDVARAAESAGIRTQTMPMHGEVDVGFPVRLRRYLDEAAADLVHVHSRRGGDWYGGLAAAVAGIPAVLSRRVDRAERRWPARIKYGRYARIIAVSHCIADQLTAIGVRRGRLAVVQSAVDPERCEPQWVRDRFCAEFGLDPDQPVIAVVAQLIERKGHRDLIPIMRALRENAPDVRMICFGAGPLELELTNAVTEAGLDQAIQFAGARDDLLDYLGHFTLLLHPARREGLGVALLEAQAAGVPVVAYRAGGVVEAVADGETGMLVTVGDAPALAAALRTLLADVDRRRAMGTNARQRIAREFNVGNMVSGNLAVYRDVLGVGRG